MLYDFARPIRHLDDSAPITYDDKSKRITMTMFNEAHANETEKSRRAEEKS